MAAILKFQIFCKNCKTHTKKCLYLENRARFSEFFKNYCFAKNDGHFEFFAKSAKHKNPYISKTVLDRMISTKFLTHRLSLQSSHLDFFQQILSHQKWRPFFKFFAKITNIKMLITRKPCKVEQFQQNF